LYQFQRVDMEPKHVIVEVDADCSIVVQLRQYKSGNKVVENIVYQRGTNERQVLTRKINNVRRTIIALTIHFELIQRKI